MKKLIIIALALVLCLGLAGIASATVVDSLHDFGNRVSNTSRSNDAMGYTSGQVCVFCHHPHRGVLGTMSNDLLWNINSTAASFNVYNGVATFNANASSAAVTSSAPQSYLCMSCHDGSVAAGSLVQAPRDKTSAAATLTVPGSANLGSTLADDHPVNFLYSDTVLDAGIQPAVLQTVVGVNTYPLFNGTMQCATCHDVHAGSLAAVPAAGDSKDPVIQFMRGSTEASEICTDCHINK